MKKRLITSAMALLALTLATPLAAERDFIYGEDPLQSKVVVHRVAAETPYRILAAKDPRGLNFEMDDGAIWRVEGAESAQAVTEWRINDTLVIQPSLFPSWSGARYFVLNERTNTYAYAEMSFGPFAGKATHNRIMEIDYRNGQISVMDGVGRITNWFVDRSELKKLQGWKLNQTLVLGFNDNSYAGWFTDHSYILINVEKNDNVSATLL